MNAYLTALETDLRAAADPAKAAPMAAYLRDQFPFLGLNAPGRTAVLKAHRADHGPPPPDQLDGIVRGLWALPEREFQQAGADLLKQGKRGLTPDHLPLLRHTLTHKSWWDTVDVLAAHPVGAIFARYPKNRAETVSQWRDDPNIWLRRTTLLFQLFYKDQTDAPLLFSLIEQNRGDDEFFIQKAAGWALRQYSKTDATAVVDFVARSDLSPLAEREALKWLKKQGKL